MKRLFSPQFLLWTTLVSLAVLLASAERQATGQNKRADAEPAAKAKKFRGRLPNFYAQVVDRKQRQTIYAIQKEYSPKIEALRTQLAGVTKERNEKVAAVLTPQQRKKVEELQAAAKVKREKKRAGKKKAAGKLAE